jgi:hypothetical protein
MPLLTGDNDLRQLASAEEIECHGLLWLLDLMEEVDVLAANLLHQGLEAISNHPRCRLPRREITIRLERYKKLMHRR